VGVAAIALILAGCAGSDGNHKYGAQAVSEQFVEDRLEAPSTADFTMPKVTEEPDGSSMVVGSVDSENGFGAKVRSDYLYWGTNTGGDNWQLLKEPTISQR
jgi:hypothetical protein